MHERPFYLFSKTSFPGATHIPILTVRYVEVIIDFSRYDRLVITSKETVAALETMGGEWKRLPVLCVGEPTARAVRSAGGTVWKTGPGYGDDLEGIISAEKRAVRWLYAKPLISASDFAGRLRLRGIQVDEVVVYETVCNQDADTRVEDDAVLAFSSPSAIDCFLRTACFKPTQRVVVIGKTTLAALPEGVTGRMPDTPSIEALVMLGRRIARSEPEI